MHVKWFLPYLILSPGKTFEKVPELLFLFLRKNVSWSGFFYQGLKAICRPLCLCQHKIENAKS